MGEFKLGLLGVDEGVEGVPGGDASNGQTKLPKSISFLLFLRFNVNWDFFGTLENLIIICY